MTFNGFGTQTTWPDGTGFSAGTGETFGGRTTIGELCHGMNNCTLVGLIIAKQAVHSFPDRKNPGREKCHFFFTLRDSPTDFINVNCWGGESYIDSLSKSIRINDIVEVRNPQIQNKQNNEPEQKWRPWTPSPFQLHVSETHSSASLFSGWDTTEFDNISHIPIKTSNDFYTLGDIIANDQSLNGEHVNIQAVVKSVGQTKDIITKTGRHVKRCEVLLFDETCLSFPLVMWDEDTIELAQTWMPKDIILFIADVKVTFDDFKKRMIATCDYKTIITANPDTMEARYLYNYAQSLELLDDDPLTNPESSTEGLDLINIKDIYSMQQLKQLMTDLDANNQQFPTLGILYAFVTSFDIDRENKPMIASRCAVCNQRVALLDEVCSNPECVTSVNPGSSSSIKTQYEFGISLSDHTGTIENCRLSEKCAENMCGCKATDFVHWSVPQMTELKVQFLLEKCKVFFKVTTSNRSSNAPKKWIRVLSCTLADPKEAAESVSSLH
ncbi:meiosis-specific with OB domain-containing protein-like [Montipora capricornis]|uniref:meiosis-specific with OB domain-containing protein-like n=1 Tax=Montipora foliosa TaxID=591990 RepID=UPI0035F13437